MTECALCVFSGWQNLHDAYEEFLTDIARVCVCLVVLSGLVLASGLNLPFCFVAYCLMSENILQLIPVIKVSYDDFHTAEEMASRIAIEYANIQNIRHVDFGSEPKALTPHGTSDQDEETATAVSSL